MEIWLHSGQVMISHQAFTRRMSRKYPSAARMVNYQSPLHTEAESQSMIFRVKKYLKPQQLNPSNTYLCPATVSGLSSVATPSERFSFSLLLADEDVDGGAGEVPAGADLVLKETAVGLLDVLRQVCKEYECGNLRTLQLGAILDLDILALG